MIKKQYMKPEQKVVVLKPRRLLTGSNYGLDGFGGRGDTPTAADGYYWGD